MGVSRRSEVTPFAVMEIIAAANARRAAGEDVLNLCAGEPVSGASEAVRERAAAILASGDLGYTEPMGSPALRAEIAGHYNRWYNAEVDPDHIAVTTGSSGGFMLTFLAAFDAGDRVALARPGYPAYRNILSALDCAVVEFDCGADVGYVPTVDVLARLHAEQPLAGVVLASPANPTGTMIRAEGLSTIARWCATNGVRLISDEIYHGIVYDTAAWPGASAAHHLDQGAVVVNSFSKYWAMTGWRLGWLVLPQDLVAPVRALAGNVALCPPALAQHAGTAAFSESGYSAAADEVARYARNRDLVLSRLPELGWTDVAPTDGAFYLYFSVAASGLDSRTWCERLLAQAGVALTPGTDFDVVNGSRFVRLSFAVGTEVLNEALDRIITWQQNQPG